VYAGASLLGCARAKKIRSPEDLRDRYADALERDDPDAAYELLTRELQAQTTRDEFRARWRGHAAEHKKIATEIRSQDAPAPVYAARTIHEHDVILRWVKIDGAYQIVDGLPGVANISTPAAAIRSLIAAIRASDTQALAALIGDDLAEEIRDAWRRRAETLEDLVAQPGAIEFTPNMRRALLRYEPGRALTLEQSPGGWKIISLE
jgi:hypothetical protein